jgi:hypothetical protein
MNASTVPDDNVARRRGVLVTLAAFFIFFPPIRERKIEPSNACEGLLARFQNQRMSGKEVLRERRDQVLYVPLQHATPALSLAGLAAPR